MRKLVYGLCFFLLYPAMLLANVPIHLTGKTMLFYSRSGPHNLAHQPSRYRVKFMPRSFKVLGGQMHRGQYRYQVLSAETGIAQIVFTNTHRYPKHLNKHYQCVLLFSRNGQYGEYIYRSRRGPELINAGYFEIQS